ncbi:hypothetical protein PPTG_23521 [Phytophthora nicotianae INRA-310]|uniref:SET domain-containing protein n=1 Tax=Phytophthora nicotianae (strain INRA-310) TaxID=761204 RepID=W2PWF8_PHYN3|nr:hypothetical protein PPTG_23521 [Phytophthora nicotianae INRA-310]ETN04976.1 hypothetical protein PPTG_23521 [Phytophthora nicotianae INRA-310]
MLHIRHRHKFNYRVCRLKRDSNMRRKHLLTWPNARNQFEPRFKLDLVESRVALGVVSAQRIPQGVFIVEYVGQILYEDEAITREDRRYQAEFRTIAEWVAVLLYLWTQNWAVAKGGLSSIPANLTRLCTNSTGQTPRDSVSSR